MLDDLYCIYPSNIVRNVTSASLAEMVHNFLTFPSIPQSNHTLTPTKFAKNSAL